MNRINKYVLPLFSGMIFLCVSSYVFTLTKHKGQSFAMLPLNASQPTVPPTQTPVASTPSDATHRVQTALQATPTSPVVSQNTDQVIIYRPDSQCEALVPEKVAVPSSSPVEATVGKVLNQQNSADFNVAGYRVSVNPKSGIATVDMRLAPNSQRKFVSLSMCEQFALFGSLRKTLLSNQGFNIKEIRFNENGQEISL